LIHAAFWPQQIWAENWVGLCPFGGGGAQNASATRPYRGLVLDTPALAVSKLGCTNLIFHEHGAKLNGQYYRDMLLMQKPIPAIRSIAGDVFVFQ